MKSITRAIVLTIFLALSARAELRLTDLGKLGNTLEGSALFGVNVLSINSRGEIIGNGSNSNVLQQAFYYEHGTFQSLGTNPCMAASINDAGQIVGSRMVLVTNVWYSIAGGATGTNVGYAQQPVIFTDGVPVNLFQGVNYGDAMGINDSGEIVGSVSVSNGMAYGFAYQNGSITDLGDGFSPTAINNRGDIAGQSRSFQLTVHPALYYDGQTHDLGTLGGASGSATAINDLDEIVGWCETVSNTEPHAFLYRQGRMQDLGAFGALPSIPGIRGPISYSYAYAINDWGEIVGMSSTTNGQHAFLYANGTMLDLNDLVKLTHINGPPDRPVPPGRSHDAPGFVSLFAAYGINDLGQIVGEGNYWDGKQVSIHVFLLDAFGRDR